MNIIYNTLIVIILLSLFCIKKKNIYNYVLICVIAFLLIIQLINKSEKLTLNFQNIEKLLHKDHRFEIQPSWVNNNNYNNLYLHTIPNQVGTENDCSLSSEFTSC